MKLIEVDNDGIRIRPVGSWLWDPGIITLSYVTNKPIDEDGIYLTHNELIDSIYAVIDKLISNADKIGKKGIYDTMFKNSGTYMINMTLKTEKALHNNKVKDIDEHIEKIFKEIEKITLKRFANKQVEERIKKYVFNNPKVFENFHKLYRTWRITLDENKESIIVRTYPVLLSMLYAGFYGNKICIVTGEPAPNNNSFYANNSNCLIGFRKHIKSHKENGEALYISPPAMAMQFLSLAISIPTNPSDIVRLTKIPEMGKMMFFTLVGNLDITELYEVLKENSGLFTYLIDSYNRKMRLDDIITNISEITEDTYTLKIVTSHNQNGNGVLTVHVPTEVSKMITEVVKKNIDPKVIIAKKFFNPDKIVVRMMGKSTLSPPKVATILSIIYNDRGANYENILKVFEKVYELIEDDNMYKQLKKIGTIHENILPIMISMTKSYDEAKELLMAYANINIPKTELYEYIRELMRHKKMG